MAEHKVYMKNYKTAASNNATEESINRQSDPSHIYHQRYKNGKARHCRKFTNDACHTKTIERTSEKTTTVSTK